MLGLILASTLIVNCTVVNFDPQPTLVCSDKTVRQIAYADWPSAWHGPELGFAYTLVDGKPVISVRDERKLALETKQAREHQLRWMREAAQNPRKER